MPRREVRGRRGGAAGAPDPRRLLSPLVIVIALAIVAVIAWTVVGFPGSESRGAEVRLFIRKGSTFREAADSLAAHGVVRSARAFAAYGRIRGHDRSLRWGTYVLHDAMSWEQILGALEAGRGVVHTFTIPEGLTIAQMAPLITDALEVPPESLDVAVRDTALLHRLDVPTPTLEGYLFPDTYTFPDRTGAREVVRTMVERFEHEWKPEWDSILPRMKLRRHDVVTLASIVEREVLKGEERPVVAAVYLNRLRLGMQLQADPTVQYALGKKPGRVLLKDLLVKSPYNTYRVYGLPPGPIGSPGGASLDATLHPAKVPFRYFVAAADGHHEFRRTYAEHLEAIRLVRAPRPDSTTRPERPDSSRKPPADPARKKP